MNRTPDPGWLRVATSVFDACLRIYPTALRRAHGEEMRQVFRDRCREAADGRCSATRILLLELLPDTIKSAASAHWSSDMSEAHRRNLLALALVTLVLSTLIFREQLNRPWLGEAIYATTNAHQARTLGQEESQVRALATLLEKENSASSSVQAAYLYRGLYDSRLGHYAAGEHVGESPREHYRAHLGLLPADGDRAARAARIVQDSAPDRQSGWIAAAAAQSCIAERGCNRAQAIDRLVRLEPDNAYAWSLAFRQASRSGDAAGARAALSRMAESRHYDDHLGAIRSAIFSSALRLLPTDAETRAVIARRVADTAWVDTDDHRYDARLQCGLRIRGEARPGWMTLPPESTGDCLRVAHLLARSHSPHNALRGRLMIASHDASPEAAAAVASARDLFMAGTNRVGRHRHPDGRGWEAWSTEEWNAWAGLWAPGVSELDVARLQAARSSD